VNEDLINLIYRCIERYNAERFTERHGLVTAYDPKTHLAKVALQPEGQETGWVEIETNHIGNGYGWAVGLTPGDGKSTGDQVIVRFQEGDLESGKVVKVVHSDQDKPPEVQAGEGVLWHKWGQKIYFKNDGSITITDGKGATWFGDGKGNITETGKAIAINSTSGNVDINK
jgi:phage baseplate assembly protein gpV